MGNLISWNDTPYPADFNLVKVERSSTELGSYTEIASVDVTEGVYYDYDGIDGDWYKIRFFSTAETKYSDYSDPFESGTSNLYTDFASVLRTAGLTVATLPESLTTETIYEWIYDISRNIDKSTQTVYGRSEDFTITGSSKTDLSGSHNWKLPYKNVTITSVGYILNLESQEFNTLRNHYDYEAESNGTIHLYSRSYYGFNRYNDIQAIGTYGLPTIPAEVEQLAKIMVAIRIFVHITGGSYNDVTSYSLGEFQESLGEPYTNLRATIDMLEKEKKRLQQATGISYRKFNMRLA